MNARWWRAGAAPAAALFAALFVGLELGGCAESPAQGFEDFYAALVDGDARVLERLDARSRARVEEAARARGLEPARALAGGGVRSTLRALREHERDGTHATLEVEDALGNKELVHLVLEQGKWRVTLAEAMPDDGVPPEAAPVGAAPAEAAPVGSGPATAARAGTAPEPARTP